MSLSLNATRSRRFPYYFDQRLVNSQRANQPHSRRVGLFILLALVSLSWVPVESFLGERMQARHASEKERVMADVRANVAEVQQLHAIIAKYEMGLAKRTQWQLSELIHTLAQKYDLDPYLILAVIRTESRFNPRAVSSAGALGLMQILPDVGEELAAELKIPYQADSDQHTLFQPLVNTRLGIYFLAQLMTRFRGNLELALIAYNRGPNGVERAKAQSLDVPTYYADTVLDYYHSFIKQRDQKLSAERDFFLAERL